ncbi:hypothetical protein GCM10025771_37130 [Niveibacterium umoris]|uniref:Nucleotide-binding universal stress UspA family protein n=1 Tax=Niveibacterium umoris TaxID=1193620 RepID=A0A840BHK2_9RHOO|nr:universal stress protein [Niveibacterium umoris]MBB4011089.1 nucleotide-binding universal stress UspA family protein [Niveibacterium umoris]
MFHKILVAIDGSDASAHTLDVAAGLAITHEALLIVAHALDENLLPARHGGEPFGSRVDVQRVWRAEGEAVLAAARKHLDRPHLRIETLLLESDSLRADDQIADAVTANGVDLVVIGSHGRRGIQRWVLGSVAERVARKVECSVFVVRVRAPA